MKILRQFRAHLIALNLINLFSMQLITLYIEMNHLTPTQTHTPTPARTHTHRDAHTHKLCINYTRLSRRPSTCFAFNMQSHEFVNFFTFYFAFYFSFFYLFQTQFFFIISHQTFKQRNQLKYVCRLSEVGR